MKDKKLSKDAIGWLRKVKRHILAEPQRIAMCLWRARKDHDSLEDFMFSSAGYPKCGTVACIGGWLEILYKQKTGHKKNAYAILGLQTRANALHRYNGPLYHFFYDKKLMNDNSFQTDNHAKKVAEHIDKFIQEYR